MQMKFWHSSIIHYYGAILWWWTNTFVKKVITLNAISIEGAQLEVSAMVSELILLA
jgi:hypothetical protein